jgi:xanthine dehydrogenase accessory factor
MSPPDATRSEPTWRKWRPAWVHTSPLTALTMDPGPAPKLNVLALMEALRTPAFYVGALGSFQNNAKRRERLLEFDVSPEEAAKLHGPVGLNLGALTPPEIAMSIVAEMTALRRGMDLSGPLRNWSGSKTVCRTC